ncbi:MAG: hypothetical protein ACYTDX_11515 [Planctomycetota bacterium]|jgi:hypothetical protein
MGAIGHRFEWALEDEIGFTKDDAWRVDRFGNQCYPRSGGESTMGGHTLKHVVPAGEPKTRAAIARQRNHLLAHLLRRGDVEGFLKHLRADPGSYEEDLPEPQYGVR